ncbi:class I adenylate-forming enzyme family protein [Pseudonocardia sp.]|uniref:class I adenylate-forming enzyme family protein n=1 Tax=Pseudonocardia sp. TaxID=60912 RepID=UPI002619EB19|nr:AMP-binding protein [Pseudonocardia sp.]MCW2720299.1 putative acyl-CoA synthetase, long-chain fatty acid:CoA ligase [Pseudonocardia sp.]
MTEPATWSEMVAAAHRGGGTAVVSEAGSVSGPELLAWASGIAEWLTGLGASPGVPVPALLGATTPEAVALTVGGAALGTPIAPLNPRLTVHELTPIVTALRAAVLLCEPDAVDVGAAVADAAGARLAVLGDVPASTRPLPEPDPDAIAGYLHTSGTTGRPKPVAMAQDRLVVRSHVNIGLLRLTPDSVYATASPWPHIAGSGNVVVALAAGATVVAVPRFTVESWTGLQTLEPTHALLVPSMIEMLLAADLLEPGTLRVLQYGSSPIHPDTLARVLEVLPDVDLVNLFGQTEGSPITSLGPDDHRLAADGRPELLCSVGRAVPGVELRVDDPDEHGVGEVVARAAHFLRPDPDGWLHTGDLGRLDDDGFLYLSGRRGDKIVRGGENVYPVEVEDVLVKHPGVAEVAVVGVPERRLGETVAAFVVPAEGSAPPTADELRAFARERLAGFKVPGEWSFVTSLPRTSSGKVQRRLLAESRPEGASLSGGVAG